MSRTARHLIAIPLALLVAWTSLAAAPSPTAAATRSVTLAAGSHVGYQFDAAGLIIRSKSATLATAARATSSERKRINGTVYLLLTDGTFAGYWMPETRRSYIPGKVGDTPYSPALSISFAPGTFTGYTWTSSWAVATKKTQTLTSSSRANASGRAVINGQRYVRIVDGVWAGMWVAEVGGERAKASSAACTAGPRVAAGSQQVFRTLPGAASQVALTFDMGGRVDPAVKIMRILAANGVCATIFATGAMSNTLIGQQVMAIIRAEPQLFEVANHTMHHCDLRSGGGGSPSSRPCPTTKPTTTFIQSEMSKASDIIRPLANQRLTPYWRPPYGAYDTGVLNAVAGVGYTKTLMWDVDTIDWKPQSEGGPTAVQISTKVVRNAVNGSNVLMHLGGWNTAAALPAMISGLRDRGFKLTTVSDILN